MLVAVMLVSASCDTYSSLYEERAKKAEESEGDIVIGIADSSAPPTLFAEGVKLAIAEVNAGGGVLGRKLRAVFFDDKRSVEKGQQVAADISKDTDMFAVVGHLYSDVAVSVSVTYEESGTLFISPGATQDDLIREDSALTFRNIPSDEDTGRETAAYALRNNYRNMAIVYDSESSGKRVASVFREYAVKTGIRIVAEKSYSAWEKDYRLLIADLLSQARFDAIFLGGILPSAGQMIKQMRDMGITVPIIGTGLLDSPYLWNIAGKAAEGTVISTGFDPGLPVPLTRNFVKRFKAAVGSEPDTWAAQGYDAIRLLAFAIEEGGSCVPAVISTTLRFLQNWKGVTGSYSFQRSGNISEKRIFFKQVREGNFEFLERDMITDIHLFEVMEDVTLRLPLDVEITTIDPGLAAVTSSIELIEQLFLGLTDFDPETYEPVPELALRWSASEDGLTYRFDLRKDVRWTDGTPVTAHDIVWAVRRNVSPKTESSAVSLLNILKNATDIAKGKKYPSDIGIHAADDFTVIFELEQPAAYFPSMAGLSVFRPLPVHTLETWGDQWTDFENIQTNGSYKVAAWEKGIVMILRKNPDYYEAEKVSIPEVRYYIIPESAVGLSMYKNNQLDIIGDAYLRIPYSELPNILTSPVLSAEYHRSPVFSTYAYAFNTRMPPVDKPLVRRAISAAIDRSLLNQILTSGTQDPARTFTRPPIFGSVDPKLDVGVSFDPDAAKEWLAQAGYPDGKGFPEISILFNESELHEKLAQAVQTFLKHYLNIRLKLVPMEWDDYFKARTEKLPGHMIRFGWSSDYPDADNWLNNLFHPDRSDNIIEWDNPVFAELMDEARGSQNSGLRKRLYRHAEEILCEEVCAVVPIYFETGHYLVKPRIKGWYNMSLGGQHIRNWRIEE